MSKAKSFVAPHLGFPLHQSQTPFFDVIFKSPVEQMENLCLEERQHPFERRDSRFVLLGQLSLMADAIFKSSVEQVENLSPVDEFRLKHSDRHCFLLPDLSLVVSLLE